MFDVEPAESCFLANEMFFPLVAFDISEKAGFSSFFRHCETPLKAVVVIGLTIMPAQLIINLVSRLHPKPICAAYRFVSKFSDSSHHTPFNVVLTAAVYKHISKPINFSFSFKCRQLHIEGLAKAVGIHETRLHVGRHKVDFVIF